MSEYQYYEFQAIDRPLSDADRRSLRELSTRARITSTSFTNSYEWGDFKGDPAELIERWFDLHLYLANWGTRRLMIRFPKRLIDQQRLDGFLSAVDGAELTTSGENLILDIICEEVEPDDDWEEGPGWLAALAPLRADVLSGDLRLFYLLWLMAVQAETLGPEEVAPLPGLGPMTDALEAFAQFFGLDADLVAAAAERPAEMTLAGSMASDAVRSFVAAMPDSEKTMMLTRLIEGDPHVASELQRNARSFSAGTKPTAAPPTVAELQTRAGAIRHNRERKENERLAAERRKQEAEEARARRARLNAIIQRGDAVWREIEAEIERRNASGYDKAASLLSDLKTIAEQNGGTADFTRRLHSIRERHAQKGRFIERLNVFG
ncbi:hypothetical protein BMW22_08660 [Rhizobium leguminosarum]|uniref:Uncharacterized protein n=1 Tax=Rhizobium leguminosarum TaxID=384 RepID=A0A1L3Z7N8_RHILE|nr:hypothetical protein [Rhizobium leguminosarum]API51684.1 hypothetical protein BMW22_08660 [Rhizobium leguminosarum]